MLVENHTVEINNRVFFCNVQIDANGCTPRYLVEVLPDARELPVTSYYKQRVISTLNEEFDAEIQQEKETERDGYDADLSDNQNDERKIFKNQF
jgi:hypothetical protein